LQQELSFPHTSVQELAVPNILAWLVLELAWLARHELIVLVREYVAVYNQYQ